MVGLVIRLILMPITSSPFDIGEGWAAIIDGFYSGDDLYSSGWYIYTPIWGYILALVGELCQLLGLTSFGDVFLVYGDKFNCIGYNYVTNLEFNFLVKIPGLIFDILSSWAAYRLAYTITKDEKRSSIVFLAVFLCPMIIQSSSMLGMFDSIMLFFMLSSIHSFIEKRYVTASILLAFGAFTKMFAIILAPIMLIYVLFDKNNDLGIRLKQATICVAVFFIVALVLYIPVIMTDSLKESLMFIYMRSSYVVPSDFYAHPDFKNIKVYLPAIIVMEIVMYAVTATSYGHKQETILWVLMLCMVPFFMFPFVCFTPTYGVVLIPAFVLLYSMKGNIAWIPWLVLIVFPIHGIAHYWCQFFYPLGAFTDLVSLESLPQYMGNGAIYTLIQQIMFLSGFVYVLVLFYYLRKKKAEIDHYDE